MDDWSIDGQEDVLARKSRTLDEVMDSFTSELDAFSATDFLERDIGQGVQVSEKCLASLSLLVYVSVIHFSKFQLFINIVS